MILPQSQIKKVLSSPDNIDYLKNLLKNKTCSNRTAVAFHVCKHFGFYDARNQPQDSSCLQALRTLEAAGHFVLPKHVKPRAKTPSLKRIEEPVVPPTEVPKIVGEIQDLEVILVTDKSQKQIWNALMTREHPLGAGTFIGRQLYYLIRSANGWLGGFGFASCALNLEARDEWIGWNFEQRQKYLSSVIGMNRFLIRPCVNCHNLASKAMSMCLLRLTSDFEERYGYKPLLVESFVDDSQYIGTCYRASNWIEVGKTKGRGRQDSLNQAKLSIKTIFMYPLCDDFRTQLQLPPDASQEILSPTGGLESDVWAQNEFGEAPLGDERLSKRLVKMAEDKAKIPERTFSGISKGDWSAVKAAYRFIDQPDDSAVTMANILVPHQNRTTRRMMGQKVVLCIQDGCDLNFNNLNQCEGLGELATNQTGAKTRGLHLHSTLAFTTSGLPLGVFNAECSAPQINKIEDPRSNYDIPIEEKKTFAWVKHFRELVKVSKDMPQTRLISICDREADFFELFDEQRNNPSVDLLVRAKQDRKVSQESERLFSLAQKAPILSVISIAIPRESARAKKSKQKAHPERPARTAILTVRSKRVLINPPQGYCKNTTPIEITVLYAREENPEPDVEPLEWILLTTILIDSAEDAEQYLRWYCLRWRIEDYHRVLKSGCGTEDMQYDTAERISRALAINLVVAWRITLMTRLSREKPNLPAEVLFSDIEIRTLTAYSKKKI